MKKVLLISNHVFHYRIRIYNYFRRAFEDQGYEFSVVADSAQTSAAEPEFELDIVHGRSRKYIRYLREKRPDFIINFLHLKDIRQFAITYWAKRNDIPVLYWNHGINLKTPNARLKNLLYYHLHTKSDAIVLYSANELRFIQPKNHKKVFVANNTLNLEDLDANRNTEEDLKYVQDKYGFKTDRIVLFVGRITPNKELEVLLNAFQGSNVEVGVVGPGMNAKYRALIDSNENFYYLGEIYDRIEVSALFNASKLFSIPGNLGLALIEALFWGRPTITLDGLNTPEIIYLKNGENGYIVKNAEELREKALYLLDNPEIYDQFSAKSKKVFLEEAHISKMFTGFFNALKFCE